MGPSNDANYVTIYLPFRAASIQVLPTLGSRDTVLALANFERVRTSYNPSKGTMISAYIREPPSMNPIRNLLQGFCNTGA